MMRNKTISLVLAFILMLSLLGGCTPRDTGDDNTPGGTTSSNKPGSSTNAPASGTNVRDFTENVQEAVQINEDTVGWLFLKNAYIDDVVVHYPGDRNRYYLRRTFEKETVEEAGDEAFQGVYFADYRSVFGDGTRKDLGVNTCIYGHAMTDDRESGRYYVKFGPLHDFRDPELARDMPYIYFSTAEENMVFEVIAVFTVNSDNVEIPYNNNSDDPAAFVKMVKEQILPRSKYDYNVKLKDTDKFLTLSTCIYTLDNGQVTNYPNTYMRYGIMARLVDAKAKLKDKADFTINEDVIIDKDGKVSSK